MANPLVVSLLIKADAAGVPAATKATRNELDGIKSSANDAGAALARTTVLLNGQRSVIGQAAQATKLQAHEVGNLTYQLNDIGMMLASGQSPFMMMMQQGPQVSQILGKRGLLSIIPAIGQGLMSLLTPFNLAMAGALAFGYAGYAAFRKIYPEVEPLNDLLARQTDLLAKLKQSYLDVGDASKRGLGENQTVLMAKLAAVRREAEKSLEGEFKTLTATVPSKTGLFGSPIDPNLNKTALASIYDNPVDDALQKLKDSGDEVNDKFTVFQTTMATIAQDKSLDQALRDRAFGFIKMADEAAKAERQMKATLTMPGSRAAGVRADRDMGGYSAFLQQQEVSLERMREASAASALGINARSPEERAAAARAAAAAQINSSESAAVRSLRIELAGTEALTKAKHDLAEAEKNRKRALDETISSAELDLSLVGKSAAEVARLTMEHQLLGAAMKDAADKGVEASQAELDLIRQKSAEYARLKTLTDARGFIQSKNEELARLRLEQQLIGANATVRGEAMAAYEAELEIRQRGLDLNGAEAQAIRDKSSAIANVTSELQRQQDAWGKVQSAGESAIDMLVDGDWQGALEEIKDTLIDIAIKAPLKNALLGTNEGTLTDLGGFSGLIAKLFGGANDNAASAVSSAVGSAVGAMNVTAGSVFVNGALAGGAAGLADLLGGGFKANTTLDALIGLGGSEANYAPGAVTRSALQSAGATRTGIPLSEISVQGLTAKISTQYADRFEGLFNDLTKAGYKINSLGEGGYSYRKVAGSSNLSKHSFGEAIDINPRTNPWSKNFKTDMPANINEIAKQNGLTWGGTWNKPDTMHFQVDKSIKALDRFSSQAASATSNLGTMAEGVNTMGNGLNKFGNTLANAGTGGAAGGGGWLSKLFGGLFGGGGAGISPVLNGVISAGGGGLFAGGGDIFGPGTGTSDSIPIWASNGEFMVKARQAAKFRPLLHAINDDKIGRFAEGGSVVPFGRPRMSGGSTSGGLNFGASPQITFVNNGTPQRVTEQREEDDGQGGRRTVFVLDDVQASNIGRAGSASGKAIRTAFGAQRRTMMR